TRHRKTRQITLSRRRRAAKRVRLLCPGGAAFAPEWTELSDAFCPVENPRSSFALTEKPQNASDVLCPGGAAPQNASDVLCPGGAAFAPERTELSDAFCPVDEPPAFAPQNASDYSVL